jgi:hypothetical protein
MAMTSRARRGRSSLFHRAKLQTPAILRAVKCVARMAPCHGLSRPYRLVRRTKPAIPFPTLPLPIPSHTITGRRRHLAQRWPSALTLAGAALKAWRVPHRKRHATRSEGSYRDGCWKAKALDSGRASRRPIAAKPGPTQGSNPLTRRRGADRARATARSEAAGPAGTRLRAARPAPSSGLFDSAPGR